MQEKNLSMERKLERHETDGYCASADEGALDEGGQPLYAGCAGGETRASALGRRAGQSQGSFQ